VTLLVAPSQRQLTAIFWPGATPAGQTTVTNRSSTLPLDDDCARPGSGLSSTADAATSVSADKGRDAGVGLGLRSGNGKHELRPSPADDVVDRHCARCLHNSFTTD
jgi:hypothetical protein